MPSECDDRFVVDPACGGRPPENNGVGGPTIEEQELAEAQLQRWAQLVADGDAEFPDSMPGPQAERLLAEVRRRRRDRLIKLFARQIAQSVRRDEGHE